MTIYHFNILDLSKNPIYKSQDKKKDGYISHTVAEHVADDVASLVLKVPKEECIIDVFPSTLN